MHRRWLLAIGPRGRPGPQKLKTGLQTPGRGRPQGGPLLLVSCRVGRAQLACITTGSLAWIA